MPPTRPSRPSTAARGRTPYSPGKGKGRQRSKTPPSSKEGSPCPPSCSYASKVALSTKDTLACVQDIILKAPSLSIDDAMAIAKTLPFTPAPKPNSHKSATIQGSKESSCIISTLTLLHQGLVECIQDLVLEDHQLAMLATCTIAISNDRRSIILCLNQPLSEDNTHAFCALVAMATNTPFEECLITNRPTYSTAKIEFLPINESITVEHIHDALLAIQVYKDHHTINSVQLLPHPMNPLVQTALGRIPAASNLGSTNPWHASAGSARNGDTPNRSAAQDKWFALFVPSSTPPRPTTMLAAAAMPLILTHSTVYIYTVLTVMALMRPPAPPAHGLSPG
ncbi:hypothetical protein AX15_003418 [Amanita polypyramis BW_CC]|nr:hypothetical protein AX15_003418 [Amanita polypyramis BW_CC]